MFRKALALLSYYPPYYKAHELAQMDYDDIVEAYCRLLYCRQEEKKHSENPKNGQP